ncbi:hypothetical protein CLV51_102850 [Chitinophaga niastensis]|uniref:Uncharacterized protein n=1 Tax=Chitinophaga niastensis TaxID=536980 RepID=A0A2P8HP40_CHINA|nr:hypothetical protein [Chitinophaga niastensis]PSL47990.1 hypothetical protein CLV51_102850 [Chitinophaga niastensis]
MDDTHIERLQPVLSAEIDQEELQQKISVIHALVRASDGTISNIPEYVVKSILHHFSLPEM